MLYYRIKRSTATQLNIPALIFPFTRRYWSKMLNFQGYGLYNEDESIALIYLLTTVST